MQLDLGDRINFTRPIKLHSFKNMKSPFLLVAPVCLAGMFTSCGSVSGLNTAAATGFSRPGGYEKVLVKDFTTSISDFKVQSKVEVARKSLPDAIASELSKKGGFSRVSRVGKPDSTTLVIGGTIDQYDDGNAALRLMIGFAAGNSNLDATVSYTDGTTGKTLGTLKADKNSWALGGALAAAQTADSFIDPIAKKIASEAKLKFSKQAVQ